MKKLLLFAGLSAVLVSADSVRIAWMNTRGTRDTKYTVSWHNTAGGDTNRITANGESATVSNLTANATYVFSVRSDDETNSTPVRVSVELPVVTKVDTNVTVSASNGIKKTRISKVE